MTNAEIEKLKQDHALELLAQDGQWMEISRKQAEEIEKRGTEIDVLRADVARYEAEAQKLRSSKARTQLEMQLVEDVLDGAEISGVFMDYWRPVHDRISALKGDLKAMTSFADLWYFVMDEKPMAFEKIVTEYSPSQWMHQAYLLKEGIKK